jgi:SAM-dependent methyltransferase
MDITTDLKKVDCPVCKASEGIPLHQEGDFRMVRCSSCRFVYLNPRPTEEALFQFYQHYLPEEDISIEAWQKMMRLIFKKAAGRIERYQGKGRLLDVGTGFGFFLQEMKNRGWEVEGIEISQKAVDYGRKVLNLSLHPGPLEKIGFPENHFDVVTSFYVIEHLLNPMGFLKECHRILKPGGLLLLRYPHTTPIKNFLRFFGIENRLYDLPAHVADFSPKMIEHCLTITGFGGCRHAIGGYTVPQGPGKRTASFIFGNFSQALFHLSGKRFLFPGVSKTILAFKGEGLHK